MAFSTLSRVVVNCVCGTHSEWQMNGFSPRWQIAPDSRWEDQTQLFCEGPLEMWDLSRPRDSHVADDFATCKMWFGACRTDGPPETLSLFRSSRRGTRDPPRGRCVSRRTARGQCWAVNIKQTKARFWLIELVPGERLVRQWRQKPR